MDNVLEQLAAFTSATVGQVFIAILITAIVHLGATVFLRTLKKSAERTQNVWDDAVIDALHKPLGVFVWVLGLSWAVDIYETAHDSAFLAASDLVFKIVVIAIVGWALLRLILSIESAVVQRNADVDDATDEGTVHSIGKLLRVSVVITTVLMGLQALGYSVSGVLAFGGVGGIAVGFAAKDLLSNFFGGLMIHLDRPFSIGDWVRSPDKEIEGTVESIGWRMTRIRTFDMRPLYIPNATFTKISVENPSRMLNRRLYETIGVRYDDVAKVDRIVENVKAMLATHPEIATEKTLMVNFNAFSASSLDFFIYCFTKTTNWARYHEIKQDVLLRIASIIEAEGAEIAFPTRTLHIATEGEEPMMPAEAALEAQVRKTGA